MARPHPVLGEEPVAFVSVAPGKTVDVEALRNLTAGRLAAFKRPVDIYVLDQPMPRNAAGKVLKNDLKAMLTPETNA